MGYADSYLDKQKDFSPIISENPYENVRFSIIIPCYNEPHIERTLNSLWLCDRPKSGAEVIIAINSSTNASPEIINQNKKTFLELKEWTKNHIDPILRFHVINIENIPEKVAGAGYARKLAMDEAIYRFNKCLKEDGVIISLDADALCRTNYLTEIENLFDTKPKTNAATIYFEHPTTGNEFELSVYEAITKYELYLRYYKNALEYCGFPYPFYTIGSCFAVSAKAYIKQGGMSKKQAGEDFYFLQKIFSLGSIEELNTTCIYPSPRPSDRVVFGTGPVVKSLIENPDQPYLTFDFNAFLDLKLFFQQVDRFYRIDKNELNDMLYQLPLPLAGYLSENNFFDAIEEINKNSSNIKTFKKRFFDWFNAFKIIKYLNFVHEKFYKKQELLAECERLLVAMKIKNKPKENTCLDYLSFLREKETKF